jgi:hypothetical protein
MSSERVKIMIEDSKKYFDYDVIKQFVDDCDIDSDKMFREETPEELRAAGDTLKEIINCNEDLEK